MFLSLFTPFFFFHFSFPFFSFFRIVFSSLLLVLPIGFADTVAFFCWRSLSALPIRSLFARLLPAGNTPRDALLRKRNTGFWVRYAGAYAHPSAVAHAATALRQRRSEISARVYASHHPRYATPPIWRIERYAPWR